MTNREPFDHRAAEILLIEDSAADAELTLIAIRQNRPEASVHWVETGDAALTFLHRQGEYADAPRPDLILLDLNLPGRDGTEVSALIKNDEELMAIPVIIFSNSNARPDVDAAYRSGANAYLSKPMEYTDIKEAMANLLDFWLRWASLATAAPSPTRSLR